MAYPDFNLVFKNQGDIVNKQYGETIKVTVSVKKSKTGAGFQVDRKVAEDLSKKKNDIDLYLSKKSMRGGDKDDELQL